jgi:GTP-dependent phosphoenolpyruvate carboxykinase
MPTNQVDGRVYFEGKTMYVVPYLMAPPRSLLDGHFVSPGYRDNMRTLLWLLQLKNGDRDADAGRHPPRHREAQPRRP